MRILNSCVISAKNSCVDSANYICVL